MHESVFIRSSEQSKKIWKKNIQQNMQNNSREMKLKTFKTVKENWALMGFDLNQPQKDHRKLNSRQILFIVLLTINISSQSSYLFIAANGLEEVMDMIFSVTVVSTIMTAYISAISQTNNIANNLDNSDTELKWSKYTNH